MPEADKTKFPARSLIADASLPLPEAYIPTSVNHRLFTLVGMTFLLFECIFLVLYSSDCWFTLDVSRLGIPALLLSCLIGHFLLLWLGSLKGCRFLKPIFKGRPPIVYWNLVACTVSDMRFGARYVRWDAIDELVLTFFGSLQMRSRSICGSQADESDLVLAVPLGAVSLPQQNELIETIRQHKQGLTTNARLKKKLAGKVLPGQTLVQSLGAVFIILILLDLALSTFRFLEMNKQYYLACLEAKEGNPAAARVHLDRADSIYKHPLPVSWVNTRLNGQGAVAAGVHQVRSEALWQLNRRDEAIEEAGKAIRYSPGNFRMNLRLSRLLADRGDWMGCRAQIRQAIKNHKGALLPRLYMLAELAAEHKPGQLSRFYQIYLDELDDTSYGRQPCWPPGGSSFLHEIFYLEDVNFVFDRLLHQPLQKTI